MQKRKEKFQAIAVKIREDLKKTKEEELTTVFVTFETSHARKLIVALNPSDFLSKVRYYLTCCRNSSRYRAIKDGKLYEVKISRAPEP
jgi:hypothetical protein